MQIAGSLVVIGFVIHYAKYGVISRGIVIQFCTPTSVLQKDRKMKDILCESSAEVARNHELVKLYLDVGQCRFIHKLLFKEFDAMLQHHITDKNDAVSQLLGHFERYAYPPVSLPVHSDERVDPYIEAQDRFDWFNIHEWHMPVAYGWRLSFLINGSFLWFYCSWSSAFVF